MNDERINITEEQEDERMICEHCAAIIESENDSYYVDDEIICEDCYYNRTYECDCCGERHFGERIVSDWNYTLCVDCYDDNYCRCERCDSIVCMDDVFSYEGEYLCSDCYDEVRRNDCIRDYYYKPAPCFHGHSNIGRYYGVELEVSGAGEDNDNASELLNLFNHEGDDERMYIKHDGSLDDGFEIVSHPMTLEFHKDCADWKSLMIKALDMGYRSHQTSCCGLHVHVSRKAFGRDREQQDFTIAKLLLFFELHWNELYKFSRRSQRGIDQWAKRYGYEKTAQEIFEKKYNCDRYMAVNLRPTDTVEFRIFRGTLKYNTFIATLQLVDELVSVASFYSEEEIQNISWSEWVATFQEPELIQYLKERRLYVNDMNDCEEEL